MPKINTNPRRVVQPVDANRMTATQVAVQNDRMEMRSAQELYNRYRQELTERMQTGANKKARGAERAYEQYRSETMAKAKTGQASRGEIAGLNYALNREAQDGIGPGMSREQVLASYYSGYNVDEAQKQLDLLLRGRDAYNKATRQNKKNEDRNAQLGRMDREISRLQGEIGQATDFRMAMEDYAAQQAEQERLTNLDIDAAEKELREAQQAVYCSNADAIRVALASGADLENDPAALRALTGQAQSSGGRIRSLRNDIDRAKSIQYAMAGDEAISGLDEQTAQYVDTLARGSTVPWNGTLEQSANETPFDVDPAQYLVNPEMMQARTALRAAGYSDEEIEQLVDYRQRQINKENYLAAVQTATKQAAEDPFGSSAKSVLLNMGGVFGVLDAAWQRLQNPDRPIDYYSPNMVASGVANAIRGQVASDLEAKHSKEILGTNVASFLYQTAMSMADSGVTMAMAAAGIPAGVGLTMLGGSAATTALQNAHSRGLSDNQSLGLGLIAGAAEIITEKIGLDTFMDTLMGRGGKSAIANIAKNVLAEGGEEVGSDFINLFADILISKDQSEWAQSIERYKRQGMTDQEALGKAIGDQALGMLESFAGGALSGGVFGTVGVVGNNARAKAVYSGDTQALVQEALELDPDNKVAQRAQERLQQGKTVSADMLRQMVELNKEDEIDRQQLRPKQQQETARTPDMSEDEIQRQFGKAGAEAYANMKPGNVDAETYYHAFNTAYQFGAGGATLQQAQTAVGDRVPTPVTMAAFTAGQEAANTRTQQAQLRLDRAKISATPANRAGKVTYLNVNRAGLTATQRNSAQAIETISKVTGINVEVFESGTDAQGNFVGENGSYDPNTNTIRIDINAGRMSVSDVADTVMLKTASHELTHFIQHNNPAQYRELQSFVTQHLISRGMNFEQLVQDKITNSKGKLTQQQAMDEVVADACEDMLRNTTAIDRLAQENRTLFERIRDWIRDFHDAVKRAFAAGGYSHAEAQAMLDKAEELQKLWDDAFVRAVENYQQTGALTGEDVEVQDSIRQASLTAGIEMVQDKTTGELAFLLDGRRVNHVTAAHIRDSSAFGALIKMARDGVGGDGLEAKGRITAEEADKQFQAVADIMNLVMTTQNPQMVWEVAGSQLFSAVKSNSDGQYGTTVDFSTVCRKTVEMIKAMSERMITLGRGLTKAEVTDLQRELVEAGAQVPCPVCYVFSRWAGIGSILDKMRQFQEKYADMTDEEIRARIDVLKKRNTKAERRNIRADLAVNDEAYMGLAATRERLNAEKKAFRKQLRQAERAGDDVLAESLRRSIENADFIIKNAAKQMNEMVQDLDTAAQEKSWLERVRIKEGYRPVPNEILFNLADGDAIESFMRDYPASWSYRTTRGPSAGKAILPYSDMRLGDFALPLGSKAADGNKTFADPLSVKGEFNAQQKRVFINAMARVRAQNLIGGQRFQSTSDFRYDYALDYIQTFFEAQALGSNMQTYTKIIEFGEMVAKIGGDVNLSAMPRNKGHEDGHLIYSNVTGIDINAARRLISLYDSAQIILVGINDEHIRLALEDSEETGGIDIGFVIPYHTSGASIEEFIRALVSNLNEDFVRKNYQDYSDVQTDHAKKDGVTEEQFTRRDLRKRLLTGNGTISLQDLALMERDVMGQTDITGRSFEDLLATENAALNGDADAIREYESWSGGALMGLYEKMWERGGEEYGVRLNSSQAASIMPHEYWNKTTTRDTAYVNGFIFRSYCYSMGLTPRFTGISSRGTVDHGDFRDSRGYWKTLIDRAMYANDGTYRDQQQINLSNLQAGMITPEYAETYWGEYKVAEPDTERAARVGRELGGENLQFSRRDIETLTDDDVLDMIDRRFDYPDTKYIPLRKDTPEMLRYVAWIRDGVKINNNPIILQIRKISQALEVEGRRGEKNKPHDMEPQDLLDIVHGMDDPRYIVYQSDLSRYAVVVDYYDGKKRQHGFAVFDLDQRKNPRDIIDFEGGLFNTTVTMFNRDGLEEFLNNPNNITKYDKEKGLSAEESSNLVPWRTEHNPSLKPRVAQGGAGVKQNSLREVTPVQPSTDGWQRTIDTQEAMRRFPGLWNVTAEESEVRNPTQIKSTVSTYRKIYDLLEAEGFDGTILDASSGLGYGTQAGREEYGFDVDDIEPYPDASYKPRYTDYSKLNKTYDAIISNAVLNVLPQDQRDALVMKMGQMLNPGGRMYINVRGKDVDTLASGKDNVNISPMEWYVASTGSYQKGFTKAELKAYLEDALGPGYTVQPTGKFGGVAVVVTKAADTTQYSLRAPTDISSRELLAGALENTAQNAAERDLLQRYQRRVAELNEIQQKLAEQRKLLRGDLPAAERVKAQNRAGLYAKQLDRADGELLKLEATKTIKAMMDREQANFRRMLQEAEERGVLAGQMHQGAKDAEILRRYNERMQKRIEAARQTMANYRAQRWDTEDRRKLRGRISRSVKNLDSMLRNPTDQKHIPDGLQGAVLEMLEVFTNDTSVFDKAKLARVTAEYQKLKTADTNLAGQYDEDIPELLNALTETIDGRRLAQLSADELRTVKDVVDHFAFMVKNENSIFIEGRRANLTEMAENLIAQSEARGVKESIDLGEAGGLVRLLTTGNVKPEYFFRDVGGELQRLWKDVLNGQSRYAFNLQAAKDAKEAIQKETGYKEWWNNKTTYTATTEAGQEITLNIGQALSLVATYQRELATGNTNHVTKGGFLYAEDVRRRAGVKDLKQGKVPGAKYKAENREAHPMSVNDMEAVTDWLRQVDERTLDYVARMVQYLSEDMSALGNETSMQLYGYRKFGEEFYYPIKSADEFLKQEPGQAGYDNSRWKHKGFTKAVLRGANNPFVLTDFDEVWGQHVSQMCMYNGMAAAQDNIVRLLNYKTPVSEFGPSTSVKSAFKTGFGDSAYQYIDTLLSDLNGGIMIDPREGAMNSMISLFKKNAVFASMSVAIQQPSSIARAMAVMDPKYLIMTAAQKRNYNELKKYSGVAIIKEIGGFDTNTGRSGADWLMTGRKRNAKETYETAATWLPQKMDEVTWAHIWNAVKAEIAATTDLEAGSEAYNRRCGERFDEVVELTQVYDSVLTRSENMRSKSGLVKAATAFMAEPTTTMNMVAYAVKNARSNPKALARTMGAVLSSILLNNLLKAIATAPRDKDEDRTWIEKYVMKLTAGVKEDLNPLGYFPLLSDIQDILDGYTVEASYASVVSDLIKAVQKAMDDPTVESSIDALAAISGVFGVPTKNLVRDLKGVINTFVQTQPLDETTRRGLLKAFQEGWGTKTKLADDIERVYDMDRRGNTAARKSALDEVGLEYDDLVRHYMNAGVDRKEAEKKARTSVLSAVTRILKPLYQAATTTKEKERIKSVALRFYVGGKQLYSGYNWKNWED